MLALVMVTDHRLQLTNVHLVAQAVIRLTSLRGVGLVLDTSLCALWTRPPPSLQVCGFRSNMGPYAVHFKTTRSCTWFTAPGLSKSGSHCP
jgi:hypothetical protein